MTRTVWARVRQQLKFPSSFALTPSLQQVFLMKFFPQDDAPGVDPGFQTAAI